ncbi:uncharacterized protein LOC114523474 isoform X1 [Dendronephthya gigantea]|uniref:uncharacterized protein LOC114523474 isoform X1 n=1 Tax=Dendronephthya gigantea TaxID=151771 RepID=UPI001068DF19|nr:uncharacterized protein LOC114523474 isoform X1 [Dendronephthya gigantea]
MPIPLFTEGEYKKSLKHVQPSFENDDKPQRCPKSNVIPQNHTHSRFPPTKESHPITIPTHNQIALHEKKFYFPHFNVKCHAFNWHKEAETASFLAENIKNHCFEEPHHDHKHYHKHEYHHQAGGEKDNEVGCKDIFCQGPEEDLEFVLDDAEELNFVVKGNDGVIIHETALQTTKVRLQNICCHKEARIVQEELGKLPGINTIRVNVLGRVAYISHDPDKVRPIDLVESLNKRHLGTSIVEAGEEKEIKQGFPKELKILLVILAVQAVLLSIALGAMFSHKAWYMWVAIAQICFGMLPVLKKCYHAVSRMQIDLNVLITVAVIGILGIRQWIEGAAVVFIFILANLLQQYCFYRVHNTISSLMLAQPSKAVMACTGELVDVEDVSIGSIIAIRQGELIPLDGVVVKGSASVDERKLDLRRGCTGGKNFEVPSVQRHSYPTWLPRVRDNLLDFIIDDFKNSCVD